MTAHAIFFSLVFKIEATLPIEFEAFFRVAVNSRLTDSHSLRNRLIDMEELDEQRRMVVQHNEAI